MNKKKKKHGLISPGSFTTLTLKRVQNISHRPR